MLELSIVMPCRNEALTVGTCIDKALEFLKHAGIEGEIIIADNDSSDDSAAIATAKGARVVPVAELGYGNALQAGIEAAEGRYIIMGDADDSYDFSSLDPFVAALRDGADLVMGNRFLGGIEDGAMPPLHRYLGNPVLSFIGRLFFSSRIRDFHCGLRGFNRDSIRTLQLNCPGMEFASEMVVKASLADFNITEVPTRLHRDGRDRAPHLNTWRDGWRHLRFLLVFSPRWTFFYPGMAALLMGLVMSALLALQPLAVGDAILDIQTLLYTSGMTIVGLQMIFFAMIVRGIGVGFGSFPRKELDGLLARFTLERGLLVGSLLVLVGIGLTLRAFFEWQDTDFSNLNPRVAMRETIPAVTFVILGAQTITQSFVLGAINILHPDPPEDA